APRQRLGLGLDLGGDLADLLDRRDRAVLVRHHADGDAGEREELPDAAAILRVDTAALQVLVRVIGPALAVPPLDDLAAERRDAVRRGDDDEIVATDVTEEVRWVAGAAQYVGGDTAQELDHLIALEGAVGVVVRLEMVQVEVEQGPLRARLQPVAD